MRDPTVSTAERNFIIQCLLDGKRVDGRGCLESRNIRLVLGHQFGSCLAELGNTKVFTQVSCELVTPQSNRPAEGLIHIAVEILPCSSPFVQVGRLGETGVEVSRLLERCIKESRCVDPESLCVISGSKVWQIRVDIRILDNDGSLQDCACLSAITALLHFRRPDVTVDGDDVTIHSFEEKQPLSLNIYHIPCCVTFGFIEKGTVIAVDPGLLEEKMFDCRVVIGMNSHRELCTLHCTGSVPLRKDQILRCSSLAYTRALELTNFIKATLAESRHLQKQRCGFASAIRLKAVTTRLAESLEHELVRTLDKQPLVEDFGNELLPKKQPVALEDVTVVEADSSVITIEDDEEEFFQDLLKSDSLPQASPEKTAKLSKENQQSRKTLREAVKQKRMGKALGREQGVTDLLNEIEADVVLLSSKNIKTEKNPTELRSDNTSTKTRKGKS